MRFWIFPFLALTLAAQTSSFEVASIRPSNPPVRGALLCGSVYLSPESVASGSESVLASAVYTLAALVEAAYQNEVDDFDLPPWTKNNGPFAVSVKIPPNTSVGMCRKMLQNFLAERFHMVTGVETREVPRFYLRVAKSGLKLKPVGGPPADPNASSTHSVKDGIQRYTFRGAPASSVFSAMRAAAVMEARARSLFDASAPGFRVAEVVDETSLTGYYDGEFQFTLLPSKIEEFSLRESLNDALTRQLGLTLELRKAPGRVLVIRSSDRTPTEN